VIRFAHVYKSYPNGALALKDVSFRVAKGEFVFLTGHSGAGKSTIMRLLFAEQQPTSGEVRVSGYSVSELRADEVPRLRRRLGIVFQDFRLLEDRSAAENIAFALEVTGARRDTIAARVMRVHAIVWVQLVPFACRTYEWVSTVATRSVEPGIASVARARCGPGASAVTAVLRVSQGSSVLLQPGRRCSRRVPTSVSRQHTGGGAATDP